MSNIPHTESEYDPNDLEALLMHKSFAELFEDERAFVLQHLSDEEEYNSMRKMLLQLNELPLPKVNDQEPPQDMKAQIVHQVFGGDERKAVAVPWKIWKQDVSWYRQPSLHVASLAAVITVGLFIMKPTPPDYTNERPPQTQDSIDVKLEDSRFTSAPSSAAPPAPQPLYADLMEPKTVEALSSEDVVKDEAAPVNEPSAREMNDNASMDDKSFEAPSTYSDGGSEESNSSVSSSNSVTLTTDANASTASGTTQWLKSENESITSTVQLKKNPGSVSLKENIGLLDMLYSAE